MLTYTRERDPRILPMGDKMSVLHYRIDRISTATDGKKGL